MPFWLYLGIGLIAGLAPSRWFWGRGVQFLDGVQVRSRVALDPVDNRRRRRWWKTNAIWVEPLRGLAAGWMLTRGIRSECPDVDHTTFNLIYYGAFVLLAGMVVLHSTGRLKDREVIVPLLFLAGVLAGCWHWVLGISALAVALLALLAMQSVGAALLAMMGTVSAVGFFLIGLNGSWIMDIGICSLPGVITFFLRHRLVVAMRG